MVVVFVLFWFLSLYSARTNFGNHRVLLLWGPPQLPQKEKRVLPKLQSWGWLLPQCLKPNRVHKVRMCRNASWRWQLKVASFSTYVCVSVCISLAVRLLVQGICPCVPLRKKGPLSQVQRRSLFTFLITIHCITNSIPPQRMKIPYKWIKTGILGYNWSALCA